MYEEWERRGLDNLRIGETNGQKKELKEGAEQSEPKTLGRGRKGVEKSR